MHVFHQYGTCKKLMLATVATVAMVGAAEARDRILMAGSSTVAPFAQIVIERFNNTTNHEAEYNTTGTGGGFRIFCGGVGDDFTDFSGASRAIKDSEVELCAANGVTDIYEIQIGYDGIVVADSVDGPAMTITRPQLFQALAAEVEVDGEIVANPYTMWSEIDSSLPAEPIEVLGPPPTSGTRDAFVELVMEAGCEEFPAIAALEESDEDRFKAVCATMREDGRFVEAGEDDNLIVQRLEANPAAFGIFGYSFLDQNLDRIRGSIVDGIEPTFENIASGDYPVSRSLFVYLKTQHIGDVVPADTLHQFVEELTAEGTLGDEGYLVDAGLIPMPEEDRAAMREGALANF
ncbi:MAG: substrate-binding domain-containing protein [Rhodospirillaceae bacterium]|nr:substrate-binding domain-containing protein [Rhodospirillaceae bacterium]